MLITLLTQRLPIDNTPINISRHVFDSHDSSSKTRTYPDRLTDRQMHAHIHRNTNPHTHTLTKSETHTLTDTLKDILFFPATQSLTISYIQSQTSRHRHTDTPRLTHSMTQETDIPNTHTTHTHTPTARQTPDTHIVSARHKLLAPIRNKGLLNSRLGVTWYLQTGSPQSPVTWLTPALFIRSRNPYNRSSFQGITPCYQVNGYRIGVGWGFWGQAQTSEPPVKGALPYVGFDPHP